MEGVFSSQKPLKFHSGNVSELSPYLLCDSVARQDEGKLKLESDYVLLLRTLKVNCYCLSPLIKLK